MHRSQAEVCTLHQHQHSGHDSYLWQSSKYHQKDTLGTRGGVPRSQKVSPGLDGGLREEPGPVGEDWDHDGVEMEFRKRGWKGGE